MRIGVAYVAAAVAYAWSGCSPPPTPPPPPADLSSSGGTAGGSTGQPLPHKNCVSQVVYQKDASGKIIKVSMTCGGTCPDGKTKCSELPFGNHFACGCTGYTEDEFCHAVKAPIPPPPKGGEKGFSYGCEPPCPFEAEVCAAQQLPNPAPNTAGFSCECVGPDDLCGAQKGGGGGEKSEGGSPPKAESEKPGGKSPKKKK